MTALLDQALKAVRTGMLVGANPRIKEFLAVYGDIPITAATVCRKPIEKTFDGVIALVSAATDGQPGAGKNWLEVKDDLNYDDLYHLFLLVEIDGSTVIMEKNQTINIGFYKPEKSEKNQKNRNDFIRHMDIPKEYLKDVFSGRNPTMNSLMQAAESQYGRERIYVYRGDSFNCQRFILDLLMASDIIDPTEKADPGTFEEVENSELITQTHSGRIPSLDFPITRFERKSNELYKFIYQDTARMFNEMPAFVRVLANGTTNAAALFDRFKFGGGKQEFEAETLDSIGQEVAEENGKNAKLQAVKFQSPPWQSPGCRQWLKANELQPIKRGEKIGDKPKYLHYVIEEPGTNVSVIAKHSDKKIIFMFEV